MGHLADKITLPSYLVVVGIEEFWNDYMMTNY